MIYTTLELLSDLRKEIQRLMPNIKVTNVIISKLLVGLKGRQFESKMTQARRSAEKGKTYLIAEDVIEGYEINLRKNFKDSMANFIEFFSRYRKANRLNKFSKSTLNFNPNLVLDYFKKIDSKEKAYWLGLLFADGHITKRNNVQLELGLKDILLLKRFARAIGFKLMNIKYPRRVISGFELKNPYYGLFTEIRTAVVSFSNARFVNHLLDKGLVKGKKSKSITLPDLGDLIDNRDLYLAFLLGYFDGDGTQGTSKITSSSYMFLDQIRKMFRLDSKIKKKDNCYNMFLTEDLFNEMLDNYNFSLRRKRVRLIDSN